MQQSPVTNRTSAAYPPVPPIGASGYSGDPGGSGSRELSALRLVAAVFLSILLFFSLFSTGVLLMVRTALDRGNLEQWLADPEGPIPMLLKEMDLAKAPGAPQRTGTLLLSLSGTDPAAFPSPDGEQDGSSELTSDVSSELFDPSDYADYAEMFGGDAAEVEEILGMLKEADVPGLVKGWIEENGTVPAITEEKKEKVKQFCGKMIGEFVALETMDKGASYLMDGEEPVLTPDEVVDFLEKKDGEIAALLTDLGYTGEWNADYGELRETMRGVLGEGIPLAPVIPEEVREETEVFRTVLSAKTLLLFGGISLFLLLLLLAVCMGNLPAFLTGAGIPLNLAGLFYCLLFVIGRAALTAELSEIRGLFSLRVLAPGLAAAVLGIALLVLRRVIVTRKKRKVMLAAYGGIPT